MSFRGRGRGRGGGGGGGRSEHLYSPSGQRTTDTGHRSDYAAQRGGGMPFNGKRMRKAVKRPTVDYLSPAVRHLEV